MARMIPIESFIPLVTVHASEAPHPVVEQQIRLAAIEFCERTRCWRHVFRREVSCPGGPIRIIPPYATIFEFEFAYFNDAALTPTQLTDIDFEPTQDDTGEDDDLNMLPDFMLVQHAETIARGALARILAIPGQTYTDMARAGAYAADFRDRMDTRFNTGLRGQQRAPARSKTHSF